MKATFVVSCPYCGKKAKLVDGNVIYPHRKDLADLKFYQCAPCDAYVGCHKMSNHTWTNRKPLGRLANAELRAAKSKAHEAFDPIWHEGFMNRGEAYAWLAEQLNIPKSQCHIGMMDVDDCMRVILAAYEYFFPKDEEMLDEILEMTA